MSWVSRLSLLFLFVGTTAWARGDNDTPGSQYTHQADDGRMELQAIGVYNDITTLFNNPPSNVNQQETKGTRYSGTLEYGLASYLSLGAGGSFTNQATTYVPTGVDSNTTTQGMQDPWVYLKLRMPLGPFTLHLSSVYDFTPGDQTVDALGNMNGYSGGDTGTGSGALELNLGPAYLGFGGSYDLIKKDITEQSTSSAGVVTVNTITGGKQTQLFAYLETATRPIALGLSALYLSSGATQTTSGGVTTDNADHFTETQYSLYIPIVSETIAFIPQVSYETFHYPDPPDSQKISKMTGICGQGTLRLKF